MSILHTGYTYMYAVSVSHSKESALHLFYTAPLFMPPSANLKGPDA